jgi:hypothetical protein
MADVVKFEEVENSIVILRDQRVLIDADIAELYAVETKRINEAVKNNPDKFPPDYMFETTDEELEFLRSKFSTAKFAKTRVNPKAFTEKGLYMIATILKSKKALDATFGIIETFAKIRELTRTVKALSEGPEEPKQKALMEKSGKLIAEVLDDGLVASNSETTIELNFAVLKFKHTVKKGADKTIEG